MKMFKRLEGVNQYNRYTNMTIIIASQLSVASCYDVILEVTIAAAILDRLVNTSHRIKLKDGSLRKNCNIVSRNIF
ncbi:MAG: ATP-binding protein [Bacteroidales bacterium]|nr:ATP-binding protein [Bacteroidales bacterium]